MKNKICILETDNGFWKEHGQSAYSKDILELYELIKDRDFEIVKGKHNDFNDGWENVMKNLKEEGNAK